MVGLAIPLAVSLKASTSVIEIVIWGAATIAVQLLVFRDHRHGAEGPARAHP
jgi:putative membrane protein